MIGIHAVQVESVLYALVGETILLTLRLSPNDPADPGAIGVKGGYLEGAPSPQLSLHADHNEGGKPFAERLLGGCLAFQAITLSAPRMCDRQKCILCILCSYASIEGPMVGSLRWQWTYLRILSKLFACV